MASQAERLSLSAHRAAQPLYYRSLHSDTALGLTPLPSTRLRPAAPNRREKLSRNCRGRSVGSSFVRRTDAGQCSALRAAGAEILLTPRFIEGPRVLRCRKTAEAVGMFL